jgi:Rad3-related DNA helicase
MLRGGRTLILTSTKALQKQLLQDFGSIGLVEIRGKNSYPCKENNEKTGCDKGVCNFGMRCHYRGSGCYYYDALNKANRSNLVITNYAYWLTMNLHDRVGGLGHVDNLILDEAHSAPDHLSDALTFHLGNNEIGSLVGTSVPTAKKGLSTWVDQVLHKAHLLYDEVCEAARQNYDYVDTASQLSTVLTKLTWLQRACNSPQWMVRYQKGVKYSPIWPKEYAEKYLFRKARKVFMTSATVRPKTLEMLGLDTELTGESDKELKGEVFRAKLTLEGGFTDKCLFEDFPSTFPLSNRLLWYVPTIRLNYRTKPQEMKVWLARIDQIIGPRLHQKGIVHTVSYKRRNYVSNNSDYSPYMTVHGRDDLQHAVTLFRTSRPPDILVSPSVVTGYDFPYDQCRYQIIGKVPFPDTRDPLLKERVKKDPEYTAYIAMQQLVQACGRGVRAEDDYCQNIIIDDSIKWFMWKYKDFAPRWFRESYRVGNTIPGVM